MVFVAPERRRTQFMALADDMDVNLATDVSVAIVGTDGVTVSGRMLLL